MKTSIFVSSFAALCLLLTFAEAPKHYTAKQSDSLLVSNYTYTSNPEMNSAPESILIASTTKKAYSKRINIASAEDLNYLKFNVADYINAAEIEAGIHSEISFANVTFTVTEYAQNAVLTSLDAIELPANELNNLKFDVTEYTQNAELTSFDAIELPANELTNLKFNLTEYTQNAELTSFEGIELPVDGLSFLKFDANKYVAPGNLNSDNLGEMPAN